MTEHPIIFSGPMIPALMSGAKTQTRRVVRFQLNEIHERGHPRQLLGDWALSDVGEVSGGVLDYQAQTDVDDYRVCSVRCPYGKSGDVLWVREGLCRTLASGIIYRDGAFVSPGRVWPWKRRWLSARFMPKWACRLRLEVLNVRVQRVREISHADIRAEGVLGDTHAEVGQPTRDDERSARIYFAELWDKLNAKRGYSWTSNPWVWVISFRRIKHEEESKNEEVRA
jgi:hypothetical protein